KPIIACNVGGIPEIVENNKTGYLIDNDDDEWIDKIHYFLDNPKIAKTFGKNAREHVIEKFNWDTIAKDFYKKLNNYEY
ncbi:MAG: glycosyltransferase, partial [Candidatus Hodarchaeota archaeon]